MTDGASGQADHSGSVGAESRSGAETDGGKDRDSSGGALLEDSEIPQKSLEYRSTDLIHAIESVSAGRELIYLSTVWETDQVRQRFSRDLRVIDATPKIESMMEINPMEAHLPELEELLETLTHEFDEDEDPVVVIDSLTVLSVYHSPSTVSEFVEGVEAALDRVGGVLVPLIGKECHDDGEAERICEGELQSFEVAF